MLRQWLCKVAFGHSFLADCSPSHNTIYHHCFLDVLLLLFTVHRDVVHEHHHIMTQHVGNDACHGLLECGWFRMGMHTNSFSPSGAAGALFSTSHSCILNWSQPAVIPKGGETLGTSQTLELGVDVWAGGNAVLDAVLVEYCVVNGSFSLSHPSWGTNRA